MMNYEKEDKPKYNIEDFRTWDNYDSDKKMLVSIEDEYCVNCQEFHVPDGSGKCPNCRTVLKAIGVRNKNPSPKKWREEYGVDKSEEYDGSEYYT